MTSGIHSALSTLPTTRRVVLDLLKKRGEQGADQLASSMGLTISAVRQQLAGLQREGLVGFREARSGPGRPRHMYHLTPAAEGLYPRAYAELTNELLDYVGDAQPELVDEIFRRRRQRRIENAQLRLAGKDFAGKVKELAAILDTDGYLAEVVAEPDGSFLIVEHNCAILGIALRYGQACGTELDFIRTVLPGAHIERIAHMVQGATNCSYRINPK
ncbi:MAG TPA: transcriptional regulator [Acidimicrobiia bacterium]|nr:transcriptional regulator [Acidimicrobiia bacterium]